MPIHSDLANLKRVRIYTHKQIDKLEPQLDRLKARLAEVEAQIRDIAPDIWLSPRRYKPNPVFARGEFTRIMMEVLREADEPLLMRTIGIRMLAKKGHDLPDLRMRKATFYRLSTTLSVAHARGRVAMSGTPNKRRWELTE